MRMFECKCEKSAKSLCILYECMIYPLINSILKINFFLLDKCLFLEILLYILLQKAVA